MQSEYPKIFFMHANLSKYYQKILAKQNAHAISMNAKPAICERTGSRIAVWIPPDAPSKASKTRCYPCRMYTSGMFAEFPSRESRLDTSVRSVFRKCQTKQLDNPFQLCSHFIPAYIKHRPWNENDKACANMPERCRFFLEKSVQNQKFCKLH